MDQGDKIKLLAASGVLLIAVIWILIYAMSGNSAPKPDLSAQEVAQKEEEVKQEKVVREKELKDTLGRGGRPVPPPSGS